MLYVQSAQSALSEDINENKIRDHALRELHLGRALIRCGYSGGLGEKLLRAYAEEYRVHFARHARAVLQELEPAAPAA